MSLVVEPPAKAERMDRRSGCERRDRILTRSAYVKLRWGVAKSLELIGAGPVVLLHTQKVGIKYKKPLR
jgi:hypothetical protein